MLFARCCLTVNVQHALGGAQFQSCAQSGRTPVYKGAVRSASTPAHGHHTLLNLTGCARLQPDQALFSITKQDALKPLATGLHTVAASQHSLSAPLTP